MLTGIGRTVLAVYWFEILAVNQLLVKSDPNAASECYTDRHHSVMAALLHGSAARPQSQSPPVMAISQCPLFFYPGIGGSKSIEIDRLFFLKLQMSV
jgi:hypothetical protein